MRSVRLAALLLIASVALSCEGGFTTPSGPPSGSGGGLTVQVADDFFTPTAVTATVGSTVTWVWTGANSHNVTFADSTIGNSTTQTTGTFQQVFSVAGTYSYGCTVHPGMTGTVTIQ